MSGLKKFLSGGKKKSTKLKKDTHGSASSLSNLRKSSSSLNLSASLESLGCYNIKEKDLSKFLKGVWNGDLPKLKQLSSKKVNWNETDKLHRSALHLAAAQGHHDIVDFLLSHDAKTNVTDSEGKTPLIKACEANSLKIVESLLNSGAECNVYDIHHVSPMHIAAAHGNTDIGGFLIDRDAKLDAKDQQQITPLHLACGLGHKDFAELLLSENTPVDSMDTYKRTPLMMACIDGHMDVVKLLIEYDADIEIFDKDGNNSIELANLNGHTSIAALLQEEENKSNPLSPASSGGVRSQHSKSPREMFSPVAQSLSNMFSASPAPTGMPIFGGPAINTGGTDMNERSEDSQSEGLGDDNSWGDTDTESEAIKKARGLNLTAMMKKKEQEPKKVDNKKTKADPKKTKDIPDTSTSGAPKLKITAPSDSDRDSSAGFKDNNISSATTKQRWNNDPQFSDDSESDWDNDNEDLDKQLAIKNNVPARKGVTDGKNIPPSNFTVPPPPPPDIEFSDASSDFDSSQPDASFGSDLPLSDMDRSREEKNSNNKKKPSLLANAAAKKLFAGTQSLDSETNPKSEPVESDEEETDSKWDSDDGNLPDSAQNSPKVDKKITNITAATRENDSAAADDSSKWDSEDIESSLADVANNNDKKESSGTTEARQSKSSAPSKIPDTRPTVESKDPLTTKKPENKLSMTPDAEEEESDWDDESSGEPSEEVLPPRTPENLSEFEPSSIDEDDQQKTQQKPQQQHQQKSTKSIFQTELPSPRTTHHDKDDDDDDDVIEQQMLGLSQTKSNLNSTQASLIKPQVSSSSPTKSVSDVDARKKQLEDLGLDLGSSVSDITDPEGIDSRSHPAPEKANLLKNNDNINSTDDDMPTETESDWEIDLRRNRNKRSSREKEALENKDALKTLQRQLSDDDKREAEKEAERLRNFEANKKAEEARLAQQIADELRQEMDENDDVMFETSSDFSYSENGEQFNQAKKDATNSFDDEEEDEEDDEGEAELLQQMEKKENEFLEQQEKEKQARVTMDDDVVKSKLQDMLLRSQTPPTSPEKVEELLNKSQEDLRVENERLKHEEDVLKKKEEALKLAEKEKQRVEQELERRKIEMQKQEIEKEKELLEKERILQEKLNQQEEDRLQAILLKEKQAREEHERLEKERKEQLDKEEEKRHEEILREEEKRKRKMSEEEKIRKKELAAKEEELKNEFLKQEAELKAKLDAELKEKQARLDKMEAEQQKMLEATLEIREKALAEEEMLRRKQLDEIEYKRKRALSDEERQRRQQIEHAENELRMELERKEKELKRLQEEENKRKLLLQQQESELQKLKETKQQHRNTLEKELIDEENNAISKLKAEQDAIYKQLEKQAQERELELLKQVRDLEAQQKRMEQQEVEMNQSYEEMNTVREKLTVELEEEENRRRRKMSDEEKKFRQQLENERESKLSEINLKTEKERAIIMKTLEEEQNVKLKKFADDARKREEEVHRKLELLESTRLRELDEIANQRLKKLEDMEKQRMKEIDLQTKTKEMEVNQKLSDLDLREKELSAKEADLYKQVNAQKSQVNEEYRDRFHELEKQARQKEHALELQIAELHEKQKRITSKSKTANTRVLSPIPVNEVVVSAVQSTTEQAFEKDLFASMDDEDGDADILEEKLDDERKASTEAGTLEERLNRSQAQREAVARKLNMKTPKAKVAFDYSTPYVADEKQSPLKYLHNPPRPLTSSSILEGYNVDELEGELQKAQRQIEILHDKTATHERIKREMEYDMEELHRTIELLSQSQNEKDKSRIDTELEHRGLKYKLEQEKESKIMAERLCAQLKDQLARSEKKITREAESRQATELANRKIVSELKEKELAITKLQSEIHELELSLESEKQSKSVQEQLYQEQLRQHEAILYEAQKTSHDHAQAVTKLEVLDETRKQAEVTTDTLRMELANTKGELMRVQSLLEENRTHSEEQNNHLRDQLLTKTQNLTDVEKKLFQVQLQLDNERSSIEANDKKLSNMVERESESNQRLQQEITSLKTQLENANREIDRLGDMKMTSDKEYSELKEKYMLEKNTMDKDLALTKQQLKTSDEKLATLEENLSNMNTKVFARLEDVNPAGKSMFQVDKLKVNLANKTEEAFAANQELKENKKIKDELEEKLRDEKLSTSRLESKLEASEEKCNHFKTESERLARGFTSFKEQSELKSIALSEKQEAVNSYLMKVKEDFNKITSFHTCDGPREKGRFQDVAIKVQEKTDFLLKNEQNNILIEKLKTELATNQEKLTKNIDELSKVKEDLHETQNTLSSTEADKTALTKVNDEVLSENGDLKRDIDGLVTQLKLTEDKNFEVEQQYHDVKADLEKTQNVVDETSQRLVQKSNDVETMRRANLEMREGLDDLKRQNVSVEADLREEKAKAEILLQDLRSANEARESLETMLSNVKGNNVALEEKLHSESLNRTQQERQAEEHKGLWESEIKSRSMMGVKMMELEKTVNDLKSELEDEKRKSQHIQDMKQGSDGKIQIYEQRSEKHEKEVGALKNKLRQYQKKLKEYESGESSIPQLHAQYGKERVEMDNNFAILKRQLDQQSTQLNEERDLRSKAENTCRELTKEINGLKTTEKVHAYETEKLNRKCDENEGKLKRLKDYYAQNYVPQEQIEEFQRALETKSRLDLNRKLQEVNMHLEEQALAREAFEKIRCEKEEKHKRDLENTIFELKTELAAMRSSLHSGLAKRDTSETQAERFKELFETERTAKERISEKLAKTKERLSFERNRTNYLFDETMNKSKVSKKLFDETGEQDRSTTRLNSPSKTALLEESMQKPPYSRPTHWSTPMNAMSPSNPNYFSMRRNILS